MGWGVVVMVAAIVAIVVVLLAIVWLVRESSARRQTRDRGGDDPSDALRILDRRLAEGQIETDEYRERRSILERER